MGILFLKPAGAILVESESFVWVSAALYLVALTIFAFAYIALRPSLRVSPIPKPGAPLITVGIYKWFRHPMYLGVLLLGLGMLMGNLNWASLIVFSALVINMFIKANYEDSMLRDRHASAAQYQKGTLGLSIRQKGWK